MSDKYKTIIFDCDGVIFNSNKIKSKAFFEVAKLFFGDEVAKLFLDYHLKNSWISRYEKFDYLLTQILGKELDQTELNNLLNEFSVKVKEELLVCEVIADIDEFRAKSNAKWFVVSGSDQTELREVFENRDLSRFFDGGIFGSPKNKGQIIEDEIKNNITDPVLFLGDNLNDWQVSKAANFDFLFVSQWTDLNDWQRHIENHQINSINKISELLGHSQI